MIRSSRVSALGLILSLVALVALARRAAPTTAAAPPRARTFEVAHTGPVDINTASADELVTLPRIGPALAARIVADREANGPFASLEALDRVTGIGPRTIDVLRPHAVAAVRDR